MSWFAAAGLALSVIGTAQQNRAGQKEEQALKQSGAEAEAAGEFQAVQLERKATQERAIGSVEASRIDREGKLLESKAKAIGAASGAGGYDTSDISAEKDYQILMSLFNSELSARDLQVGAEVARREGADAARAYEASASASRTRSNAQTLSNVGQTGLSLYQRFGNR